MAMDKYTSLLLIVVYIVCFDLLCCSKIFVDINIENRQSNTHTANPTSIAHLPSGRLADFG